MRRKKLAIMAIKIKKEERKERKERRRSKEDASHEGLTKEECL